MILVPILYPSLTWLPHHMMLPPHSVSQPYMTTPPHDAGTHSVSQPYMTTPPHDAGTHTVSQPYMTTPPHDAGTHTVSQPYMTTPPHDTDTSVIVCLCLTTGGDVQFRSSAKKSCCLATRGCQILPGALILLLTETMSSHISFLLGVPSNKVAGCILLAAGAGGGGGWQLAWRSLVRRNDPCHSLVHVCFLTARKHYHYNKLEQSYL